MTDDYVENIYDHLKAYDIVTLLKPLLDGGNHTLRLEDGKAKARHHSFPRETPWIHVKHAKGLDCGLWSQVTFAGVVMNLPTAEQFVPRWCQGCWKVVVKPRTLQQLFNLLELQKKLDRPSKCGIELRATVHGLYGGYFYTKSLQEGIDCYEAVKAGMLDNEWLAPLVDEVDKLGKTTRVILKRACTEFEHLIGNSAAWKITPEQMFIEDLIRDHVASEQSRPTQPEHLVWNIKRRWIEFAYQWGDPTYALYTGGKPIYPHYVTYHQPELLEDKGEAVKP
jgi:hypothetical protein